MERTHLSSSDSGSKDGSGSADNDQPYQFGRRPRSIAPWPFTERQYAMLLMMRGRVSDAPHPSDENAPVQRTTVDESTLRAAADDLLKNPRRGAA